MVIKASNLSSMEASSAVAADALASGVTRSWYLLLSSIRNDFSNVCHLCVGK